MRARTTEIPVFLILIFLSSCGDDSAQLKRAKSFDLDYAPRQEMIVGCGLPLDLKEKRRLSLADLKNEDCVRVRHTMFRNRDSWKELTKLGECSNCKNDDIDYRGAFVDGKGDVMLGFGYLGRMLLKNGKCCSVSAQEAVAVCRIYNELFETSESRLLCPLPLHTGDWMGIVEAREMYGDSVVKVYGMGLNVATRVRLQAAMLVRPRNDTAFLMPEQVSNVIKRLKELGACTRNVMPNIDYRVVAIDLSGRVVFGIGAAGMEIRIGNDEYCEISPENILHVQHLYYEMFGMEVQ